MIHRRPLRSRSLAATILALAIGAVAALPLLPPRLPAGADAVTHLYTLIQVDDLLRHGELSLRWLPFGNGGYGNPRFVFYPAAPFYLAGALTLAGLDPVAALRLLFATAFVVAALGAYRWLRAALGDDRPGASAAALVGSAVYVLSPYLIFATYRRASFAEALALGLLPWVALAFDRLYAGRRDLVGGAVWFGALVLVHPLTAATFGLYVVARALFGRASGEGARSRGRRLALVAGALGVGAMLAAASWVPAAFERGAIRDTHETARGLRVEKNTLPLSVSVAGIPAREAAPALALGALLLGAAGLLAGGRAPESRPDRGQAALGLGLALTALLLTTSASAGFWAATRGVAGVLQFPHRLFGVGTLGAALAVAAGIEPWLARVRPGPPRALLATLLALAASASPALFSVRYLAPIPALDVVRVVELERRAGRFGTGEKGDFVPRGARRFPPMAKGSFDPSVCWQGGAEADPIEVTRADCGRTRFVLDIVAPAAGEITLRAFAFPGWRASIDGASAPIATDAMGRMVIALPAGASNLRVDFGATPDRLAGLGLSMLSALALGISALRRRRAASLS